MEPGIKDHDDETLEKMERGLHQKLHQQTCEPGMEQNLQCQFTHKWMLEKFISYQWI